LEVQRRMRERVWEAAHVQLATVTLDTDTTVHTLFGNQMGGRKGDWRGNWPPDDSIIVSDSYLET